MNQKEIKELTTTCIATLAEYELLVNDEVTDRGSSDGASEQSIAAAEQALGVKLPTSYREFLKVRNGIRNFDGGSHILSVEEMTQNWVKKDCTERGFLFLEFEDSNPFDNGAIPVLIGQDSKAMLLWLPDGKGGGVFSEYDIVEHLEDYNTLFDYIKNHTEVIASMIQDERAS